MLANNQRGIDFYFYPHAIYSILKWSQRAFALVAATSTRPFYSCVALETISSLRILFSMVPLNGARVRVAVLLHWADSYKAFGCLIVNASHKLELRLSCATHRRPDPGLVWGILLKWQNQQFDFQRPCTTQHSRIRMPQIVRNALKARPSPTKWKNK